MSCECKDCGKWIEHYVGHKCDAGSESAVERIVITKLNKMCDAPNTGETILAYHHASKRFHPVHWKEVAGRGSWGNSWHRDYSQSDFEFGGWIPYPVYEL